MKITSLENQRKDKNRLNLYVDDSFYSGIDIVTAARLGFYEGKIISENELYKIDREEEYQKCMNSALNLASRRLQSEKEYWRKLGKKYEKSIIGKCLDRLRELGYANDEKFAEMWIRERSKTRGKKLLEIELKEKGIEKQLIEKLLSTVDKDNELEGAKLIARKKFKPEKSYDENYSKVMSLLTRKGYKYSIAKQVFKEINKTAD